VSVICETEPVEHGLPGHGWTLKKLRRWLKQVMGCDLARSTLHRILQAARLRWKKCQKVLKKADPQKRAAFMERFQELYEQLCRQEIRLVYIDEAHIHRDMDLGYTWAEKNKIAWRMSDCASLADRINWYGAYDFCAGQCFIWNEGNCNKDHTIQFLQRMTEWLGDAPGAVVIIWDGATWHRAKSVQAAAAKLGLTLIPLPAYSPDLNPIENLWRWLREEVTRNHCHQSMRHLFDACKAFIDRINAHPYQVVTRLWPKFELDPEYEKLLVSN
jgi:transposase